MKIQITAALLAFGCAAASAEAALTIISPGPMVATHAGNLVTDGSFEPGPPNAVVLWATGTTGTPFAVPPGWTTSGPPSNYARWGHDSASPLNIANSALIPDGVKALYFGDAQGASVNVAPIFHPNGEVTFATAPTVTTSIGAPVILSQTVPTNLTPAASYVLSFWASGEGAYTGGMSDGIFGLRVTNTEAGDPFHYLASPSGGASIYGDQMRYEFAFTPLDSSQPVTVEFYNWGHFSLNGGTTEVVLDDVIVNPVPEPGTLALLAVPVLVLRRRRRSRV